MANGLMRATMRQPGRRLSRSRLRQGPHSDDQVDALPQSLCFWLLWPIAWARETVRNGVSRGGLSSCCV